MIVPLLPVVSQPSRAAAAVRPAPLLHDQTAHGTQRRRTATRPQQKQKRRPFRAFFAFLVVAGLLGGAAYAGWYYFLRNQVTWASDVEPLAKFVEESLHREFTNSVDVDTLPTPEYEAKLGRAVIDQAYADLDGSLTALRAVGIAGPDATPSEVGHIVASVRTSFYAPAESTIYRLEGTTPLYEFGMVRSLSSVLIDQQVGWSKDFEMLTDSQQVGLLAIVNSVADEVANARAPGGSAEEAAAVEFASRLQVVGYDGDQIPLYARMAMWPGFTGIPRYPVAPAADPLAGLAVPASDAVVFDLTRDATTAALTVQAPVSAATSTRTLGVQFWYEAMLPALGAAAARDAALLWAGDAAAITTVNNFACINANIATANESDQAAMSAALIQWAQTRPVSSAAVVSTQAGNVTLVSMCEPAEGGSDALGGPTALQLVSRASSEGELGHALLSIGLPDTRAAWNCAVLAHRGGTLADYESGTVDPTVISLMNDVVRFCSG